MAEEKTNILEANLAKASEDLFTLLNKQELTERDKIDIDDVVKKYPAILEWRDFSAKIALPDLMTMHNQNKSADEILKTSAESLKTTERVLDNLQKVKESGWLSSVDNPAAVAVAGIASNGETIGTQTVKNICFLQALQNEQGLSYEQKAAVKHHNTVEYQGFIDKAYDANGYGADKNQPNLQNQTPKDLVKDIVGDRRTLVVENKQEAPLKTLSIEELNDKAYQGTLTVEQANERRKRLDEKKIADMNNVPGDRKRQNHESKDRFKDEDVIKYMYEEWLLGGASWLFNTIEDKILNIVDAAAEIYVDRSRARSSAPSADKKIPTGNGLQEAVKKSNTFCDMVSQNLTGLSDDSAGKKVSYDAILSDLSDNLNNPRPNWKYFDKDDEFVKKLQANPTKSAAFLDYASKELGNRTQIIEMSGKLAMMMTSTRMIEEFMGDDRAWRRNGEYLSDDELKAQFTQKTKDCQKNILKAVAVISEDTRLLSEAAYDNLEGDKPDLKTFTAENTSREINAFLKQLNEATKNAVATQQKDLDDNAFDSFGAKKHDRSVARSLNNVEKLISQKISNGAVYDNSIFKEEHSKERIEAKTGLLEEAIKENSANSMAKTFEHMKQLNQYQAQTNDARFRGPESRKQDVQRFKDKIVKRDSSIFNHIVQNSSGKGM